MVPLASLEFYILGLGMFNSSTWPIQEYPGRVNQLEPFGGIRNIPLSRWNVCSTASKTEGVGWSSAQRVPSSEFRRVRNAQ